MTGPKAFALALFVALIAVHTVSSATVVGSNAQKAPAAASPKSTVSKPPGTTKTPSGATNKPAAAQPVIGNKKSQATGSVQAYDEPDGADYSKPALDHAAEQQPGEYQEPDQSYSQEGEKEQPYDSYDREQKYDDKGGVGGPNDDGAVGDNYQGPYDGPEDSKHDQPQYDAPGKGYDDQEPEQQYPQPGTGYDEAEKPYDEPKASYPETAKPDVPCPKAMSADAVENVYLSSGTFNWRARALESKPIARRSKRGARSAAMAAQQASVKTAQAPSAKIKEAGAAPPHVGTASIPRVQALTRAKSSGPASKPAASKPATVRTAATVANKGYPGLSDPQFMLPVDLEIAGRGAEGTYSGELIPTDEAIAVGPYPDNPAFVTILHSVNAVAEIITASKKTGERIPNRESTKVSLAQLALSARSVNDVSHLTMGDPTAFYDCKDQRWVLIWTSFSDSVEVTPTLFVAVSNTIDPLADWTVFSLEARPSITVGYRFCEKGGKDFSALAPQSSFSEDGIFISVGASCSPTKANAETAILSTLFALPKAALYGNAASTRTVLAATYMGPMSWKSSISHKEQSLVKEDYRTFNNLITPARPQDPEDVDQDPLFVMKVDGAYISVATLTDEPLGLMTGIDNAPSIRAIVVGKGEDFSNKEGLPDGNAVMPQPETDILLDSGDTGMLGGKYGIRAYGTVHHKGLLYTTMSEFFGVEEMRIPSIYWGIIATHPGSGLCKAARKKWGFISSQDALALAYPVIAARPDGSAIVVFSYSGGGELPHSLGPAYPGVASAIVGAKPGYGREPCIVIVKLGRAAIEQATADPKSEDIVARWGDYSATQVYEGQMWYAVPIASALQDEDDYRRAWHSWIGVEDLDAY